MKNFDQILSVLNPVLAGLGKHFGSNCEFVVHDYSTPNLKTIVSIVNGEVTNRKVGDAVTSIGLRVSQGIVADDGTTDGIFNYITQTRDGRILKSSTIYLREENNTVCGSLCINYDITDLQHANAVLSSLISTAHDAPVYEVDRYVDGNIDNLLIQMINISIQEVGIPVVQMTKQQKMEGIKFLKDRGAFKIQRAADVIAQYYCVSRFTVYNYLNELERNEYSDQQVL